MTTENGKTNMSSLICNYIETEIVTDPRILPIGRQTSLIKSGIIDSLSLFKLVQHVEKTFNIKVIPADVTPNNFETVDALCDFISRIRKT